MMLTNLIKDYSRSLRENKVARLTRARLAGQSRLHLGCGDNVLAGWANIDTNGRKDVVQWDLTRPLPVPEDSIARIYNEHFIEHITRDQAKALLASCRSMLMPGGVLRITTPSLEKLVRQYLRKEISEWHDVGWMPKTPCQMMNEGMRLWGHQFLYDAFELKNLLRKCGFAELEDVRWRESRHPDLRNLECRPYHDEIMIEATK